jgi:hypothetical protein
MHSSVAMMSPVPSSQLSTQMIALAAADSFGDTACSACAIFRLPIESIRATNATRGSREHLVKRIDIVMVERVSVGVLTLWRSR